MKVKLLKRLRKRYWWEYKPNRGQILILDKKYISESWITNPSAEITRTLSRLLVIYPDLYDKYHHKKLKRKYKNFL